MEETFTIDELLIALQGHVAPDAPASGIRMAQLVEMTGMNEVRIARRIRALMAEGKVRAVRVPLQRIDGTWTKAPAYRWVGDDEA